MATLSDFEKLLPTRSPGEKAQILKWVVQELGDAFPGIDSRLDVCGGEPCTANRSCWWRIHRSAQRTS